MKYFKFINISILLLLFMFCDDSPSRKQSINGINENPNDFPLNPLIDQPILNSSVIDDILDEKSDISSVIEGEVKEGNKNYQLQKNKLNIQLDISSGKWFKTPLRKLNFLPEDKYINNINSIKKIRKKIMELKANSNDKISTEITDLKNEIIKIRKTIGYGNKQQGIHTYWANQNLTLNINNVKKPGWYILNIIAKNSGKLPDFYGQFNISIYDEINDKYIGGLFIEASDVKYRKGRMCISLQEGDNKFNLLWKNNAYEKDKFDVNLQIKNIIVRKSNKNFENRSLVRKVHQYSKLDGKFFWDKKSVWTYSANHTLGFNFPDLKSGVYEIIIYAKNYGSSALPPGYENFKVSLDSDGLSREVLIPANTKKYLHGSVKMDLTGGDTNIFLTWTNDESIKGKYDTNIQIKKIKLKYLKKSKRSPISAYLLGTSTGNKMLIISMLFVAIFLTSLLSILNKKRSLVKNNYSEISW